jgi:hypothetical protein
MIDAEGVRTSLRAIGAALAHETKAYLLGGASAVLAGFRDTTASIDLCVIPPRELERVLPKLNQDLGVEIVVTSTDRFIPAVPGWEERSAPICREGRVEFFHLDFYSQVLAKIERASARDSGDVRAMLDRNLIDPKLALELFEKIEPEFVRYPAIDGPGFRRVVEMVLAGRHPGS